MRSWCVVSTQTHGEVRAEANLLRQGYNAWLPYTMKWRRHARRREKVRSPVFPGYLFVQLDLERDSWTPINSTFGVRNLLTCGTRPEVLPDSFVFKLQKTLEDGSVGDQVSDLSVGTPVRIISGPFADYVAEICELGPHDRVKILLDILGGKVRADAPRSALIASA